jgi:hypothetical protein
MSFIVILMIIINIVLAACLYASVRIIKIQLQKEEIYKQWFIEIKELTEDVYNEIKRIDRDEMFQKDDDVGVIFEDMIKLISSLNDKVIDLE